MTGGGRTVFDRKGTGLATSLLWLFVLGLIAPFLTLVVVVLALGAAGVDERKADELVLAPFGVVALAGLSFGVRSHLRTRGKELRLEGDALVRVRFGGRDELPFARLASIQVLGARRDDPKVLILRSDDGAVFELGHRDWRLDWILEEVRRRVIPAVARARLEAIARGEPLVLREPRAWALGSLLVGIVGLPLAVAALFEGGTGALGDAADLLARAPLLVRGGGFQLLANGLAARGRSFEDFPYEDVAQVLFGDEGVVVKAKSGAELRATHAAENAEVAVAALALKAA